MSTRTKNLLFAGILILIMLGLLCWFLFARPEPILPTVATSTPVALSPTPLNRNPAPALHLIQNGQYYTADMQYPSATALENPVQNEAAVALMKAFAESTLASFKQDTDIASITPQAAEDEGLGPNQKYSLMDQYKTYYGTHTVSYAFTVGEDTLGAHPNYYIQTFTFDSTTGANLSLSDLFTSGSNYLNQLSTLSRTSLIQQQGTAADVKDFIDPGATPDATNFSSFVIDGNNLTILFAPYQVASYAQGPQTVQIPLDSLKTELKTQYQQ